MKDPALGRIHTFVEGQILVVEHTGPFNSEYWEEAAARVYPVIEKLELQGPFAILVEFHTSVLSTIGAMEVIASRNRGFGESHPRCAGVAIAVARDVEGLETMRAQLARYLVSFWMRPDQTALLEKRSEALAFLQRLIDGHEEQPDAKRN